MVSVYRRQISYRALVGRLVKLVRVIFTTYIPIIFQRKSFLHLFVTPKILPRILGFFKNHSYLQLRSLSELLALDKISAAFRVQLQYILSSHLLSFRLGISAFTPLKSWVFTTAFIYSASDWLEREMWDLFGVFFWHHPDLRRILSDYGFIGHPLQKNFPLMGYFELFFNDASQSILQLPLICTQSATPYQN